MRKQYPNLRRRTFFTPLLMPMLGVIVALALLAGIYSSISTTTIVLVRHAEKVADGSDDPGLTPDGQLRAQRFARMFSSAGADALIASQYRRTIDTLKPLADDLDLEIVVMDAGEPGDTVASILDSHRGDLVIVAGHSNTIPDLIERFADIAVPAIDESDYSGIYVLTLPRFGEAKVLQIKYPD